MENQDIQNKTNEPETPSVSSRPWMLKRTQIFIIALAIITVILLVLALFTNIAPPKTATAPKITTPKYMQTTLKLTTPQMLSTSSYQSEVQISTNQNEIMAVGLRISFDPNVLSNIDIKMGSFFASPSVLAKNISKIKGIIAYDLVLPPGKPPVKGNGTLAIISFSAPHTKGSTSLNFLPITKVMDQEHNISVLKTATGITLAVK